MSKKMDDFVNALYGRSLPVLTLDNKWHQIFASAKESAKVKELEEEINELLKRQGKMNSEIKSLQKIKSNLMNEIISLMESFNEKEIDKKTQKKLDENKRLINECNEKIEKNQDELLDFPKQIEDANKQLMLITMESCYNLINRNQEELEEIGEWITQVRIELKKKILEKQKKEVQNQVLYSYMHDIFGAEVIELFDMKFMQKKEDLASENQKILKDKE